MSKRTADYITANKINTKEGPALRATASVPADIEAELDALFGAPTWIGTNARYWRVTLPRTREAFAALDAHAPAWDAADGLEESQRVIAREAELVEALAVAFVEETSAYNDPAVARDTILHAGGREQIRACIGA